MKRLALSAAALVLALGSAAAFASPPASLTAQTGWVQKISGALPLDTVFVNEHGVSGKLADEFEGKPLILVFSYFQCPNLCGLVLNGLVQALHQIPQKAGSGYRLLTLSIDPRETPRLALMKQRSYLVRLNQPGASAESWRFLTGTDSQIHRLTDAAGFRYAYDPASGQYSHPSGFVVVTPRGKISRYFFGIQFDAKALSQALTQAQAEKPGTLTEQILLYCFHFDPARSVHGPLILRWIRWTGSAGALGLFGLLLWLSLSHPSKREGAA